MFEAVDLTSIGPYGRTENRAVEVSRRQMLGQMKRKNLVTRASDTGTRWHRKEQPSFLDVFKAG